MQSISLDNQFNDVRLAHQRSEIVSNSTQEFSIEEYNIELNNAEAYMNAGNFILQDEAEKLADKWF